MTDELFVGMFKDEIGEYKGWFKDKNCTISHRLDGPAKEYVDGTKHYMVNSLLHRKYGPAIVRPGSRLQHDSFWEHGESHNYHGAASGYDKVFSYYIKGKKYSNNEFVKLSQEAFLTARSISSIKVLFRRFFSSWSEDDFSDFNFYKKEASQNEALYSTPDVIPVKFLLLKDASINKSSILCVPPDVESLQEGLAWSFSQGHNEYKPEIQT